MSTQGHDPPLVSREFIDVFSSIGTWLAVLLAAIALVGIIAPWLAIRATQSDRNRAFNLVHDQYNVYMTVGWRVPGSRIRIMRRTRVPNLAPALDSNSPIIVPLLPAGGFSEPWTFQGPPYRRWNNGWARLCALIEAHRLPATATKGLPQVKPSSWRRAWNWQNWLGSLRQVIGRVTTTSKEQYELQNREAGDPVSMADDIYALEEDLEERPAESTGPGLGLPKGGLLEIKNSQSAMAVSRYWVLAVGLLGRYTSRSTFMSFSGGRAEQDWADFGVSSECATLRDHGAGDDDSEMDSEGEDPSMSSRGDAEDENVLLRPLNMLSSRHGLRTWTTRSLPEIYGFTGRFKSLGWHRNTFSYQNLLTFYPRSLREIQGTNIKQNAASVQTLFWLANGFIPSTRTSASGRVSYDLLSFRGPGFSKHGNMFDHVPLTRRRKVSLQEVSIKRLPPRIWKPAMAFGLDSCRVFQWEAAQPTRDRASTTTPDLNTSAFQRHKDLSNMYDAFFSIEWDDWGYLIWADQFDDWFNGLLRLSRYQLGRREESVLAHLRATCHHLSTLKNIRESVSESIKRNQSVKTILESDSISPSHVTKYSPSETSSLVHLEATFSLSISNDVECLRPLVGLLLLTRRGFRNDVFRELDFRRYFWKAPESSSERSSVDDSMGIWSSDQSSSIRSIPSPPLVGREFRDLYGPPSLDLDSPDDSSDTSRASSGPAIPSRQEGSEGSRESSPDIDQDEVEFNQTLAMAQMPTPETTFQLAIEDRPKRKIVTRSINFRYVKAEKAILWDRYVRKNYATRKETQSVSLSELDLATVSRLDHILQGGPPEVVISNRDVLSMCVSAMIRCALWESSLDSYDLLKFVNDLDGEVWVL